MRVEIKKKHLVIVPENEQDRAFIEDTLKVIEKITFSKIKEVNLGFESSDLFVLKSVQIDI